MAERIEHALGANGLRALENVLRGRPLLALDFDGTLAAIVEDPDHARIEPALSATLAGLAAQLPVAIVTGRSVADLEGRLGFRPDRIIGSHGAENPAATLPSGTDVQLDAMRDRLRESAGAWRAAGLSVEDKQHSLALHYRRAPDREAARRLAESLVLDLPLGLRSFGGKCVLNVVAQDAPDKADAVHALVRHFGADRALYLGDDVNDEAVFERAGAGWLTVRVGREGPPSAAMYALDDQSEVAGFLRLVLEISRRPDRPAFATRAGNAKRVGSS